jgi:Kae1-associated kinase Bud32
LGGSLKRISEGAEAVILQTDFLGNRALIKRRINKEYRVKALDDVIRATRTKKEARILSVLSTCDISVPSLLMVTKFDIYIQTLKGRRLSTFYDPKASMKTTFDKVGESLATIHNAGISHGDYTPANILVDKSNVSVIDFGLSEITNSIEDKAMDIILLKRAISNIHYLQFIEVYKNKSTESKKILQRVAEIEKRGRYMERSLNLAK